MVGKTLGHYEILEPLGAGGMGEVYRARDTKLDRDVAIKVLPDDFATDPNRLARFEREAKLLASLNHANIAAIYGLEDEGEQRFIAMELVEGETLAQRISRAGRFEVDETLHIARQIAEALEAAHESGVIHRDLKPANVIVTPAGHAKVLDFGLAKSYEVDGAASDVSPHLSHSPTMMEATRAGMIMGTAAYMSPEQAKGKPVDKRTDIWSFGALLYEMLTGRNAFQGDDVSETLAAILKDEPEWKALPGNTPRGLAAVARRCLTKNANDRLHDIADARIEIARAIDNPHDVLAAAAGSAAATPVWRRALPWAVAAIAIVVAVAGSNGFTRRDTTSTARTSRSHIALPASLAVVNGASVAISPDGSLIAFWARARGTTEVGIWVRDLDGLEPRRLDGAVVPSSLGDMGSLAFSPDGDWIIYNDGYRQLHRVRIDGGNAIPVVAASLRGVAWLDNETIVYSADEPLPMPLERVSISGGAAPADFTPISAGMHRWPQLLPDGRVLFTEASELTLPSEWRLAVTAADGGEYDVVHEQASYGRYVPTGHLVFGRNNTMFAVAFDLETLQTRGPEVPVVDDVAVQPINGGGAAFDFSSDGTLVYLPSRPPRLRQPFFAHADGTVRDLDLPPGRYRAGADFTSDGSQRLALPTVNARGQDEVIIYTEGRPPQPLPIAARAVAWHPDNQRLVYLQSGGAGEGELLLYDPASGDSTPITTTRSSTNPFPIGYSADESTFLYTDYRPDGNTIIEYNFTTDEKRALVVSEWARLSPDGRWLAYQRGSRVYVRSYAPDEPLGREQIVAGPGLLLDWAGEGNTMFFVGQPEAVYAVDMGDGIDAAPSEPRFAFPQPEGAVMLGLLLPAPDASGLVAVRELDDPDAGPNWPVVVFNWFEELKELVPTGR